MEHQIDKLFRRQHRAKLAIFAVVGLLVVLTLAVVVMTKNTDQALTFFSSAADPGTCRVSMSGVNSCHFGEGRGIRLYNATCPTRSGKTQATAYFTPQSLQSGTSVCQSQEWFMGKLSAKESPWYACCTNWESIGGKKQEEVAKPIPDTTCKVGLIDGTYRLVKSIGSQCYTSYEFLCYNKKYEVGKVEVINVPLKSDGSCMPWAGFKKSADDWCQKQYPCFDKTTPIGRDILITQRLFPAISPIVVIEPAITAVQMRAEKIPSVCGLVAEKGVSVSDLCGGPTKCNSNDKTCLDTQRYRHVNFYCSDGQSILKKYTLGESTSCKPRSLWTQYAKQLCNDYMKCPVLEQSIPASCTESCSCDPNSSCAQVCEGSCQNINNSNYCCRN
ncbi:hypothetical protein A3C23_01040 [Candidatus Roizmanbacteria bacterium RIFCSPHIGHO2_02_FULL_37_13b]|uniref:Uncharacterized protein n=1 Tax=Candidatus Roizmanbacteria bacterium RIFCSPLOWO2_02_FULL_36_11 TaxID=1802071 RepID=A0A1F7JIT0_9BACT|nr:MAG: hypothetical protein A3C23_01040 [Candidatus Roizmanbacteria bacterium RIFCSPHIGHO2_02_FULL_37_13b]OGK55522.1 MAG: hypothetical protein A3H78_05145 [Candidatus Roizmanbacteria bacterium RIFCSPLOWO2_02_FULL_36_11]